MIAITFALPAESSGLPRLLRQKRIAESGKTRIIFGTIGDRDVAICHTGVGRKSCERNIENLLHTSRPDLLISSGFAGSLNENLEVGDVILAQNFSDTTLAKMVLEGCGGRLVKLVTAKSIIDSPEARNQIARESGADAVDMETEIIARVCSAHGIRMLSLRVISDTPREPLPISPDILFDMERQRTNAMKLFFHLLRKPLAIGPLIRFSRNIAKARANLTDAIVETLNLVGRSLFK